MLDRLPAVFKCLSDREVRYLVIGGVAAIVHGVPRTTFDLDILVEATTDNAARLLDALDDAGIASSRLTDAAGILTHEITVFRDILRIDVQTRTPGIDFAEAWDRRETRLIDGVPYWIVSKRDLIAAKEAAGRPRDIDDLRALRGDAP